MKKKKLDGFKWTGWMKPTDIPLLKDYFCIGFSHGDKFDGFYEWMETPKGKLYLIDTSKYKSGKKKGQFKYLKTSTLDWKNKSK